ncbi:MAG: endonuclease III [Armatimonadetes bacterium]|nr:endonuclease III [Armatimonadota bacterium]
MQRSVLARVIRQVDKALAKQYGAAGYDGQTDLVGGLVNTILSQNTTAANQRRASARLRETFPDWDAVADADPARIAEAIHPGGLADMKAVRIRDILRQIRQEQGRIDLGFLASLSSEEATRYLMSFKGVGPKTAACVLMFELGRPAFPVDTHVLRICKRLGWLSPDCDAERAHEIMDRAVPADVRYQLHVNMVTHGRKLCRPNNPRCAQCPIRGFCEYADKTA